MMKRSSNAIAAVVLVVCGCGGRIETEIASLGDAGPTYDGGTNDAEPPFNQCGPSGPEVVEKTLPEGDVFWDDKVVHVVLDDREHRNTILHLSACTVVRFGTEGRLVVQQVEAIGTLGHPVTFEMASLGKTGAKLETWKDCCAFRNTFDVVQLRNVWLVGRGTMLLRNVRFAGPYAGVQILDKLDPDSTEMVWEDTQFGVTPIRFEGRNVLDQVEHAPPVRFPAGHANSIGVRADMVDDYGPPPRLRDRGFGYRWYNVDWSAPVFSKPSSLAIDPGVTIQFDPNTGLEVGDNGLSANGTTERPVVLRGREGKTWLGLRLGKGSSLHHTSIVGAGMPYAAGDACTPLGEQPMGAIILKRPAFAAAFDDVTFRDLPGSAFVETGPPPSVDLTTGSTFVNVAGCKQIVSKASDGTCPDPAPCAK